MLTRRSSPSYCGWCGCPAAAEQATQSGWVINLRARVRQVHAGAGARAVVPAGCMQSRVCAGTSARTAREQRLAAARRCQAGTTAHRRWRAGGRIGGRGAVIVGRGALGRGVIVAVAVLSPAAARGCDQGLNQNERAERGGLHKMRLRLSSGSRLKSLLMSLQALIRRLIVHRDRSADPPGPAAPVLTSRSKASINLQRCGR